MNQLDFLNSYWEKCNTFEGIASNKHFLNLDKTLMRLVQSPGIREDSIKTRYKGAKKWDMHFPEKKIAIEYKTASVINGCKGDMGSIVNHRLEEAIGAAVDLKRQNEDYKLGYIWIFVFRTPNSIAMSQIDKATNAFHRLIEDGIYDFFFPAMTFGVDDHREPSTVYTFSKLIAEIKSQPNMQTTALTELMV